MKQSLAHAYAFHHRKEPYRIRLDRGVYFVGLWGADGGFGCRNGVLECRGGSGAFVGARMSLKHNIEMYLFVGSKGGNSSCQRMSAAEGGWNGGGKGGMDMDEGNGHVGYGDDGAGGGGGATDLRLTMADRWDDVESLKTRILVAAGGSGSQFDRYGAPGGELRGFYTDTIPDGYVESSTSQSEGFALGQGEDGEDSLLVPSSGGGGGYYGGRKGVAGAWEKSLTSSSGSSFVAGFEGCEKMEDILEERGIELSEQIMIGGHMSYIPRVDRNGDGFGFIWKSESYLLPRTRRVRTGRLLLSLNILWLHVVGPSKGAHSDSLNVVC